MPLAKEKARIEKVNQVEEGPVALPLMAPEMPSSREISTADVFDAILNRAPGPLDIPLMDSLSRPVKVPLAQQNPHPYKQPIRSFTTTSPLFIDVTIPFSSTTVFRTYLKCKLCLIKKIH